MHSLSQEAASKSHRFVAEWGHHLSCRLASIVAELVSEVAQMVDAQGAAMP